MKKEISIAIVSAMLISFAQIGCARANDGIEVAGHALTFALPAAAGGVTIFQKDGKGAFQFAESMALTVGSTLGLQYSIRENGPDEGDDHSFPSAHTSVSFASAEFLRKRYGWNYGAPAYALAGFVGFSRVQAKKHYAHDVIAGAAIGIGCSWLFTEPYKGWHVQPQADTKFFGIRLSRSW